jgi:1-acyl-sn-glycerol-3-phosphate acyltransferase
VQVAETVGYRSMVVASQSIAWVVARLLKLWFTIEMHLPPGLFEHGPERCLILAPMHKSVLDPWLIMSALGYRQWRVLMPVRTLATQTFYGPLKWFKPLIRILYRVEGVVELPPKKEGGSLPDKIQGLLDALQHGDVVAMFPEGGVWKKRCPPIGEFAPGVVYLHRRSGARVLPIALWSNKRLTPGARYIIEIGPPVRIPEPMNLEAGAAWLHDRTLELYERARRRAEQAR